MRLFTITCVLFFMLHMMFPSYSVAISFKRDGDNGEHVENEKRQGPAEE